MYTLHMIGMMYFDDDGENKFLVLVPNGTNSKFSMPHQAAFYVEADDVVEYEWWGSAPSQRVEVPSEHGPRSTAYRQFLIPGNASPEFEISGCASGSGLTGLDDFHSKVPHLRGMDPAFCAQRATANTIARFPLANGELDFYKVGDGGGAQLLVDHVGEMITITAATEKKWIHLKHRGGTFGTEIVFANMAGDIRHERTMEESHFQHERAMEESHFQLYAELDPRRDPSKLGSPTYLPHTKPLPHCHAYLRARNQLTFRTPGTTCSPGCC